MSPAGRLQLELDRAELPPLADRACRDPVRTPVVVEAADPEPLLAQPVEVDVGHRAPCSLGEAFGLLEEVAALVDERLAVPGQIGGGLALTGRREQVRRAAAGAGAADEQPAVLGPGHGDRRPGQVGEHRRPGERRFGARRDGYPHVLADLDVEVQPGDIGGGEDQVGAEGCVYAADPDAAAATVVTGSEVPLLVELAVVGQVGLRADAEDRPSVDDHGTVEHPGAVHERRPDHDHRQQVDAGGHDVLDRGLHGGQQRVLQQQVVDRIAAQRKLREDRHRDPVLVAGPDLLQDDVRVPSRVRDRDRHRARGHPREPLRICRVEIHDVESRGGSRHDELGDQQAQVG